MLAIWFDIASVAPPASRKAEVESFLDRVRAA
jgi:hypothetical protein